MFDLKIVDYFDFEGLSFEKVTLTNLQTRFHCCLENLISHNLISKEMLKCYFWFKKERGKTLIKYMFSFLLMQNTSHML